MNISMAARSITSWGAGAEIPVLEALCWCQLLLIIRTDISKPHVGQDSLVNSR